MPGPWSRVGRTLVAALVGALLVAGCSSGAAPEPEQAADPAPGTRVAPTVAPTNLQLGVQMFAMWRDWDDHEALMDKVQESGSRWLRVDVGWCSLEESGPGIISDWYQERLDEVVADARAHDLKLLLTLTCSPSWARPDARTRALPADPAQYGRVAGYLADRYRGRVAAWELWNEPDCQDVKCPNGDPVEYVPVLKAGYEAIKAVDPKVTVISGGVSGVNLDWIRRMFEAGAGDYMDALAVNPYLAPADSPPDTVATQDYSNPYRITNVAGAEDLLTEMGHPDMPIWFTEFGWSTGRTPGSRYDGVPEDVQAAYLTEAIALIRTKYPDVTHAFWFTLRDRDDASKNENGFGLLRLDQRPKPSYAAFVAAVAGIAADRSD